MTRMLATLAVLPICLAAACTTPDYRDARGAVPTPATPAIEAVPVPAPTDPELVNLTHVPLVHLQGDGYARGYRYGRAFPAQWRRATDELEAHALGIVAEYVPVPCLARFGLRQVTAVVAQHFTGAPDEATMPREIRAYVQGIADGAGIDTSRILRTMALVMLADASCSAFVAFGPATDDGRLLQMRNLDWGGPDLPAWEGTVLLLHEPPCGQRWLSIGFLGLVGSISGINEAGIAVSEIGADTQDKTWRGMPMPVLLDRVLAEARTLDEAVAILRAAPGTGGYNYMIGSARERRGAVVEKTARRTAVFEIGRDSYRDHPFFRGYAGFDCRADTAADPAVRSVQNASGGPGSPEGRTAYEQRYKRQLELFEGWGRQLDLGRAEELAAAVAPRDNLHSILYDWERGRVVLRNQAWWRDGRRDASKEDRLRTRAAVQPAVVIDLRRVFRYPEGVPAMPRPRPPASAPRASGLPPPTIVRRAGP